MRVRFTTQALRGKRVYGEGEVIEVDEEFGLDLIAQGVVVREAVIDMAEIRTADVKRRRGRKNADGTDAPGE